MAEKANLRVIIVGAGIGGLALANCLQHAGIDFVLIEKRDRLDPQTGASIGILPNGARILDQIDCYEDLLKVTASMKTSGSHRHDGSLIGNVSDTLQLMQIRTGYAVAFLDRQILLRILADHIMDYDRVRLNTTVRAVEQAEDKVTVQCSDGSSIEGDVVVGADGTYSFVRQEMWRHADASGQGEVFESDKNAMSAEYMCLFGISTRLPGMETGQTDRTYAKDLSTLSYVGKEGKIFWFVFVKMDQVYRYPAIPRYTEKDAEDLVQRIGDLAIREKGVVNVRSLYESRITSHLVAIEEAAYKQWSFGRAVCLGDAIHKMTANLGAGASSALESAAALSNVLVPLRASSSELSTSMCQGAFHQYQKARALRVGRAMAFSNALTRVQALKGTKEYIYTHYIAPRSEDSAAEAFTNFVIGAEKVDHLPVPRRSMQGTMPFNPKQGWGFEEKRSDRAFRALPLLATALLAFCISQMTTKSEVTEAPSTGMKSPSPSALNLLATAVTSSDVVYGIWLFEAVRSINKGTWLQLSTLLGIGALHLGCDVLGPLYLFVLYAYSPIENFRASDNRLTDMSYTVTAGPLLVALDVLPKLLARWPATSHAGVWTLERQPYLIGAAQFLLASSVIPRTRLHDRLWAVRKDVPWIRATFVFLIGGAALSWVCRVAAAVLEVQERQSWSYALLAGPTGFAVSVGVWILLVNRDLREAGMSSLAPWQVVVTCLAVSAAFGPGALLGAGWLWREEVLVKRRHKDAAVQAKF